MDEEQQEEEYDFYGMAIVGVDLTNDLDFIVDSGATSTLIRSEKFFTSLQKHNTPIRTVGGQNSDLIQGSGTATILLPSGHFFVIDRAYYAPSSRANLLSFKDVRSNACELLTSNSGLKIIHRDFGEIDCARTLNNLYILSCTPAEVVEAHTTLVEPEAIIKLPSRLYNLVLTGDIDESENDSTIPAESTTNTSLAARSAFFHSTRYLTDFSASVPVSLATKSLPLHPSKNITDSEMKDIRDERPDEQRRILNAKLRFKKWHARLGHPSISTMKNMVRYSALLNMDLSLEDLKLVMDFCEDGLCQSCKVANLTRKPFGTTDRIFAKLEQLDIDIKGPIYPPSGNWRYFMVIVDRGTRWGTVCFLENRALSFVSILKTIFALESQNEGYAIRRIMIDSAGEFRSLSFTKYCELRGIVVHYSPAEEHQSNGLAENYIKRITRIMRVILLNSALPVFMWKFAAEHANDIARLWPHSALEFDNPYYRYFGSRRDVSHLRIFGCLVHVPIKRQTSRGATPDRRPGIYLGHIGKHIVKWIHPDTGNIFLARSKHCEFDENVFLHLQRHPKGKLYISPDWPQDIPIPAEPAYEHDPTKDFLVSRRDLLGSPSKWIREEGSKVG